MALGISGYNPRPNSRETRRNLSQQKRSAAKEIQEVQTINTQQQQQHISNLLPKIKQQLNDGDSPTPHQQQQHQSGIDIGVSSAQGHRPYQEDEYCISPFLNHHNNDGAAETHLFGVFDGHAGGKCSKSVSLNLPEAITREAAFKQKLVVALKSAIRKVNDNFLKIAERMHLNDGSTGVCCILRGRKLIVSNIGDSRIILLTGGKVQQLSTDHKPASPEELRRIIALGGTVVNSKGVPRVNGILAVSRAFGNFAIRHVIRAEPDIFIRDLTEDDNYLILASDGLWDVLRNVDVCQLCYTIRSGSPTLSASSCAQRMAESLVRLALDRGSQDNVTCMVLGISGYFQRIKSSPVDSSSGDTDGNMDMDAAPNSDPLATDNENEWDSGTVIGARTFGSSAGTQPLLITSQSGGKVSAPDQRIIRVTTAAATHTRGGSGVAVNLYNAPLRASQERVSSADGHKRLFSQTMPLPATSFQRMSLSGTSAIAKPSLFTAKASHTQNPVIPPSPIQVTNVPKPRTTGSQSRY